MKFSENTIRYKDKFLLKLFIWLLGIIFFNTSILIAQNAKLGWDPSTSPNISSYNIYRATSIDSSFSLLNNVIHPDGTYLDKHMEWDTQYFYVATSVDRFGNESGFSNMVDTTLIFPTSIDQIGFIASLNNNNAILKWTIPYNSGIAGVELQRSKKDSVNFQKISYMTCNPNVTEKYEYHFTDKVLPCGNYHYRLKQFKSDNSYQYSEIISISVSMPLAFKLFQNRPNPFNSSTTISYTLPKNGDVELKIYNIKGEEIFTLVDDFQDAGYKSVVWHGVDKNGGEVSTGFYYVRLKTSNQSQFRRMLLIK